MELSLTEPLHLSCYTIARALPLLPAPALSSPCPGASPYPWKSRPGSCPQGLCLPGTAHTGEGPEPGQRAGLLRLGWGGGTEASEHCFCLLSTCQDGAFICSLSDCQGETWLSLPLQSQESAQGWRALPTTQASANACFWSTGTHSLPEAQNSPLCNPPSILCAFSHSEWYSPNQCVCAEPGYVSEARK